MVATLSHCRVSLRQDSKILRLHVFIDYLRTHRILGTIIALRTDFLPEEVFCATVITSWAQSDVSFDVAGSRCSGLQRLTEENK